MEFWQLTPGEFFLYVRGKSEGEERQWEQVAWQTAHLMNCWVKGQVTVSDLLGKPKEAREMMDSGWDLQVFGSTKEEFKEFMTNRGKKSDGSAGSSSS